MSKFRILNISDDKHKFQTTYRSYCLPYNNTTEDIRMSTFGSDFEKGNNRLSYVFVDYDKIRSLSYAFNITVKGKGYIEPFSKAFVYVDIVQW